MDAQRGLKASCTQCGGPLSAARGGCKRCGAIVRDTDSQQYGLLDLGADAGGAEVDALALDTSVERTGTRQAARAGAQRTAAGKGGRATGQTLSETGPRKASSASSMRNAAVNPAATQATPAAARRPKPGAAAMAAPPDLPDLEDPAAMPHGRGMMLGEDPFNAAFNGNNDEKLELEEKEPEPEPEPEAPEPVETPEQLRARQIRELAGYGPEPKNVAAEPAYWIKVMLRKRALETELLTLAAQRKRADDGATEALAAMGQALAAMGQDERLAKLHKQLAATSEADTRIGHVEAESVKRKQDANQELARLDRDLARLEQKAAPARALEAEVAADIEKLEAALKRAEQLRKKAEGQLEALKRKGGGDVESWGAIKAEHDARLGEVQSLGIQMRPLQDDLAVARKALAQHTRAIGVVQGEKQAAANLLDRAQQNHRVTSGSARGALQQALVSLANAAFKLGLEPLVAKEAMAVVEARERAQQKRASEELMRAATLSYNHGAYARGMQILLGGSGLFLFSLILMILF